MVGLWVREVVNSVALTRLELNNMTERYTAIWTLLLSCVSLCTAPATIAQDPIRVETKEVLVPVFVIDNARYQDLRSDPANFFKAISAGNMQLAESITETIVIRGLIASDFRLFEDGQLHAVEQCFLSTDSHPGHS